MCGRIIKCQASPNTSEQKNEHVYFKPKKSATLSFRLNQTEELRVTEIDMFFFFFFFIVTFFTIFSLYSFPVTVEFFLKSDIFCWSERSWAVWWRCLVSGACSSEFPAAPFQTSLQRLALRLRVQFLMMSSSCECYMHLLQVCFGQKKRQMSVM